MAKSKNRQHPKLLANSDLWSTPRVYPQPDIFLNDLQEEFKNSDIYNFADDNTISGASKNRDTLLETLKIES